MAVAGNINLSIYLIIQLEMNSLIGAKQMEIITST